MRRTVTSGILLIGALAACASPASQPTGGAAQQPSGAPAASSAAAPAGGAARAAPQKLAIGVPDPSLSYLPAHVAWKRGSKSCAAATRSTSAPFAASRSSRHLTQVVSKV